MRGAEANAVSGPLTNTAADKAEADLIKTLLDVIKYVLA
jgi:hypothetical protein